MAARVCASSDFSLVSSSSAASAICFAYRGGIFRAFIIFDAISTLACHDRAVFAIFSGSCLPEHAAARRSMTTTARRMFWRLCEKRAQDAHCPARRRVLGGATFVCARHDAYGTCAPIVIPSVREGPGRWGGAENQQSCSPAQPDPSLTLGMTCASVRVAMRPLAYSLAYLQ